MDINVIEWVMSFSVAVAVVWIVFLFLTHFGKAASEMQEEKIKAGDTALAELYIGLSPESFFFIRVASAAVMFLLAYPLLGMVFGVILAVAGFVWPRMLLNRLREKRVKKVEAQLVEGLELLGSSLKSGLTLQQAVELLIREFPPPISQEFTLVLAESRLGVEFAEALERMAQRLDSSVVYILASGVGITKQCGGDITQIFSNIATTIREQATIEGKLDAVTAQGRFQGLILGLMPFALMIVLYFIDPAHVETLFSYQLGIWAVAAVVFMIVLAQLWIRKLLAIDV